VTSAYLINRVAAPDVNDLLPLLRAYCNFYEVSPSDSDLVGLTESLIRDAREGVQLLARDATGEAVGFATVFWTWSTLSAARIGVMHDLFVVPHARGRGLAESLIEACRAECAGHGVHELRWQTAPDNRRAQAVYERVGATREQWIDYWLAC
jgi:GNAT superfamily N-acetyltransferase